MRNGRSQSFFSIRTQWTQWLPGNIAFPDYFCKGFPATEPDLKQNERLKAAAEEKKIQLHSTGRVAAESSIRRYSWALTS